MVNWGLFICNSSNSYPLICELCLITHEPLDIFDDAFYDRDLGCLSIDFTFSSAYLPYSVNLCYCMRNKITALGSYSISIMITDCYVHLDFSVDLKGCSINFPILLLIHGHNHRLNNMFAGHPLFLIRCQSFGKAVFSSWHLSCMITDSKYGLGSINCFVNLSKSHINKQCNVMNCSRSNRFFNWK